MVLMDDLVFQVESGAFHNLTNQFALSQRDLASSSSEATIPK